ncbi:phosphoribosylanthranilate isomerase [Parasporobacterium paucivorans]|uniref:N-(5'-phosphoribosyl)anthranilate isomerase n=1 Tax=Parasporobacterium paucivorans DSM 15970 TaxID=1122934 RepID=A0A1M6IGC4_9FIRM|nr:phosphoribosylanthranilate isomerase [Parasporobacterium paucivorans]SHJ33473.1 phosphoribosylanthranilate isomerase [Parasporobacterium paucivorans DSM 15970]
MKIKICGLCREEDVIYTNGVRPHYAGFVFAKSRRQVSVEQAEAFRKLLDPEIEAVGVFVNENAEKIAEICNKGITQIIQLHGDETEEYIQDLRQRTDAKIIKAVRVRDMEDIRNAEKLSVDFLLLDTYRKDVYGGTGKSFDWSILGDIGKPFFLAGGISMENIDKAMETKAYCLDVSSGVETDGRKDREKMEEIVRRVRL